MALNGVLLIDKPLGPTSHDVVARIRNTARERSVGHTGTLDPRATGLLPLVLGKATRLAPYLSGRDKTYDAVIQLGQATDSDDAGGEVIASHAGPLPDDAAIRDAAARFIGTFEQIPPAVSAKRVDGHKAYDLAREKKPVALRAVPVTVRALDITAIGNGTVALTVTATAGFYVRALARDLGRALGCGAHLASLRRTQSGAFDLTDALPLAEAERLGPDVASRLIDPAAALAHFPAVTVTELGLTRVTHGNALDPMHLTGRFVPITGAGEKVRVLDEAGHLVALADSRGGALHPSVVLAG